jgi:hypothetical protein
MRSNGLTGERGKGKGETFGIKGKRGKETGGRGIGRI